MASYSVQYIFSLVDKFSGGGEKMAATAMKIHSAMAAAGAAMSRFSKGMMVAGAAIGVGMAMMLSSSVQAAAKFEEKMAEVRKVVPNMTRETMWEMGNQVLALSAKTAVSADNVADIFASGARMGIRGTEALTKFAETVVKVSAAWDGVSAKDAGDNLGILQGKFFGDLDPLEAQNRMVGVADAINYLAQNTAGVKNIELLKFFQTPGASFAKLGITAEEAAAYGAVAMKTGDPGGKIEGTRASTTLNKLLAAANAPVTGKKGLTKLGQAFKTLGMTQEELAGMLNAGKGMEAILSILDKVKGMDVVERQGVLSNLLSDQRAARQLGNMSGQLNEVKRALAEVSDYYADMYSKDKEFMEWLKQTRPDQYDLLEKTHQALHRGSVDQEYNARMDTMIKQAERFGMAWEGVRIQIGKPFLPMMSGMYSGLADATDKVRDFIAANQDLTKSLGIGALVAGFASIGAAALQMGVYLTGAASKASLLKMIMMGLFKFTVGALVIAGLVELVANFDAVKAAAQEAAAVVKSLWGDGKTETGEGSNYYNLNKMLENTAFGRAVIGMGLVKPIDEILADQRAVSPYDNIVNMDAYRKAQEASDAARRSYSPFEQMQSYTAPDKSWLGRLVTEHDDAWGNGSMFSPSGNPAFNEARIPQSMAITTNVEARTSFDPATINVNVTGQVNGPLNGTGSGTLQARPSRGEATSSAGASSPAYDNAAAASP